MSEYAVVTGIRGVFTHPPVLKAGVNDVTSAGPDDAFRNLEGTVPEMLFHVLRSQIQAGIRKVKTQQSRRLSVTSCNAQSLREVAQAQVGEARTEADMIDAHAKIVQQSRTETMGPAEGQVLARLLRDIRISSRSQREGLSEGIGYMELRVASEHVIALREVVIDLQVTLVIIELVPYSATEVGSDCGVNLGMWILRRSE